MIRRNMGQARTVLALKMATHNGTHLDGPVHFLPGSPGTDEVPLENLMGPARAIEIEGPSAVRWAELRKHDMGHSERLLFKTGNSQRCWNSSEFVSEFVSLAEDAANLAAIKTLAPGIDYLSMGSPAVHRTMPPAGAVIIEGWNLSKVRLGEYGFFCLPLRIRGGDGLPIAPC